MMRCSAAQKEASSVSSFRVPVCCRLLSPPSTLSYRPAVLVWGGKGLQNGEVGGGGLPANRMCLEVGNYASCPFSYGGPLLSFSSPLLPCRLSVCLSVCLFCCWFGVVQVMIDRGRIDEPSSCHLCGNTMSMELVHNRCLFTDKQMIRLQVRSVSLSIVSYRIVS